MGQGLQREWAYALEQLYEDQDPSLAADAVAQLIWWLEPSAGTGRHRFELRERTDEGAVAHALALSWDMDALAGRDPRLTADLQRVRGGKKLPLIDRPRCGAYGLAMVAISCLLGRRVVAVSCFRLPSLLLDTTPGGLCGVEVAGLGSKDAASLQEELDGAGEPPGKRAQLSARPDVREGYVSVWCREPAIAIWQRVTP